MAAVELSFVIPCLNSEAFIGPCLRSILDSSDIDQALFEIILVDDGSIDQTKSIAREVFLEKNFANFKIIDSKLAGPGGARNAGMKVATGRYLWFVDSDDEVLPNSLAALLKAAKENDVDVLWFDHIEVDAWSGAICKAAMKGKDKYREDVMAGADFLMNNFSGACAVWAFLFKRETLLKGNLSFEPDIAFEDILFVFSVLDFASRVKFVRACAYKYHLRQGSVMRSQDRQKKRLRDSLYVNSKLRELAHRSAARGFIRRYINRSTCWVLRISANIGRPYFDQQIEFARKIGLIRIPSEGRLVDSVQARLINTSPRLFFAIAVRFLKAEV